jgi:hypothetical protein
MELMRCFLLSQRLYLSRCLWGHPGLNLDEQNGGGGSSELRKLDRPSGERGEASEG